MRRRKKCSIAQPTRSASATTSMRSLSCTPITTRTRIVACAKAMEGLAQGYPDDDEAQIHYALALNTSASAADKTYVNQLKGASILEPIALRQPQHPGVAPAAAHAQHMPSHVFTRVGYWRDSIGSNLEAARVAKADKESSDELHAMDYHVYAYLQLGQDQKARDTIDEMNRSPASMKTNTGAVCPRRFAGAICNRARRLEGSLRASG